MKKHLYLYAEFFKMDVKRILSYKLDFIIGNLGYLLDTLTTLFVLLITLNYTELIGGFSLYQLLFLYGFLTLNSIKNTSYMIYFVLISYNFLTSLTIMILYFDIFSIRNSILSYRLI